MKTQTKQQLDFIKMVASCLANRYMESLFEFCTEKNYAAHIGGLAEILDWSREFYNQYHDKISNWEMFRYSSENIYNAASLEDLIVEFGRERIKMFYAQNSNHAKYFLKKYSTIQF